MNTVLYSGLICFDPINYTKKHEKQSAWKRIAMVILEDDITKYYAWFVKKRYGIQLNKPIRGAHISFINDSINDIMAGLNSTEEEAISKWNIIRNKLNGSSIEISLDVDVRTNANHWWLNVSEDSREKLNEIRNKLGLGKPYFGMHMSIGNCNEKNKLQSEYILKLINKFGKNFIK